MSDPPYAWHLDFYNELAAVNEHFQLLYHVKRDGRDEIELMDTKRKRRFLAPTHVPSITIKDIKIGGKLNVFGRTYKIIDFEDAYTRKALGKAQQKTAAIITAKGVQQGLLCKTWLAVDQAGLTVTNAKMVDLSPQDCSNLVKMTDAAVQPGPVVVLELFGEDCAAAWSGIRQTLETTSSSSGGGSSSSSSSEWQLGGAVSAEADSSILQSYFGNSPARVASSRNLSSQMESCTCVAILPSAVGKGLTGTILNELMDRVGPGGDASSSTSRSGLRITGLIIHDMDRTAAADWLEVYKLVEPAFLDMVTEAASGPLVAIELTGPQAVNVVRTVVGPRDIDTAKRVRPNTLRARYGVSAAAPAIHCTDLEDDGPVDCEFMFGILPARSSE